MRRGIACLVSLIAILAAVAVLSMLFFCAVSMAGYSILAESTPSPTVEIPFTIGVSPHLIVDAPALLRKRLSTVEEILGQPTKIWYPGEPDSPLGASEPGQWRVYLVNGYHVDIYFREDGRAHDIRLGVSYGALPDEGYDLRAASAFDLLSRMGMGPELLDRMPDHEFYTESGDLLAWRWDNLHGYDVVLMVTSPTGHISTVQISR